MGIVSVWHVAVGGSGERFGTGRSHIGKCNGGSGWGMKVLRPMATVLCVLGCWDGGRHNEETAIGLAIGTVLFLGQSLVVTIVKHGWFAPGYKQLTGLIPGAGATGSFLVLVTPMLLGLGLCSTNAEQGGALSSLGINYYTCS